LKTCGARAKPVPDSVTSFWACVLVASTGSTLGGDATCCSVGTISIGSGSNLGSGVDAAIEVGSGVDAVIGTGSGVGVAVGAGSGVDVAAGDGAETGAEAAVIVALLLDDVLSSSGNMSFSMCSLCLKLTRNTALPEVKPIDAKVVSRSVAIVLNYTIMCQR
jgi:hypothetical protein